ncbi:hypothetical protein [Mammaliicoccus sciuri]|uniref:hypothetical protein n=1 Tax=Mammaliicoccus sciuri TaxID=1296 RepID=UPI00208F0B8A|nr:hypothetical protein [Mammaliicoccus sciuri]MCO4323258.1 hypothetical protein [Mammaliicoccus sciuri]
MAKVNYENIWKAHKESKIKTYIKLHKGEKGLISFKAQQELAKELTEMDSRDGTNDFGNVLYDLQMMSKEDK